MRLLCRCEAMAAEKRDPDEWRLEKVGALHCRLELDSLREVPGATAGPRPPPAALATPLRWAPPRPPASSTLVPGAQLVPASSTWAPSVFQPLTPPWLCPLRARWGGSGVPADTHLFSPVRGSPRGHAAGPESPDEVSADGQKGFLWEGGGRGGRGAGAVGGPRGSSPCWDLSLNWGQRTDFLFCISPSSKPVCEVINEYSRKVDFLKGMLQAEKLVSTGTPAAASSALSRHPLRVPRTCSCCDASSPSCRRPLRRRH